MLYRKCFVLNISSKIISAYNRSICFQSNDLNKRLCHSVNLTESTLLSSTISHELLSTWINSKYIPNDLLQQEFSDVFAQNNLKNLLILCQDEVSVGRWRRIESSLSDKIYHHKNNSYSLLDSLFLDLYQMELTVDAITGVQMIGHVCRSKFGEQNLSMHNQNFDHLRIRLDILNPDLLLTKLYDPLVNIGVKHVNQLLERCPELPLSTMTCISPYPSNILSQKTILQEALEVLNHYLMHNDLVNVVQRFPSVLLRDRLELISLCEFCIHELHLESFDIIRALSSPNHKHSLRHSTGISICKCPVWELPLKDVRARFTLLRLAGCWPLSRPSVGKSINVDQKLASFLKASPAELSHCLNMNLRISTSKAKNSNNYDDKRSAPAKFDVSNGIVFTKSDIQFFEEVYSRLLTDTEDTVENVCHDVLTDDDHDDGSKESDLEI
ncbi:unnamed protein product [Heterobilharzia americana]|nr:unnamed protein product [Heterobilharzia americana]